MFFKLGQGQIDDMPNKLFYLKAENIKDEEDEHLIRFNQLQELSENIES
jgi:hypothetical protein